MFILATDDPTLTEPVTSALITRHGLKTVVRLAGVPDGVCRNYKPHRQVAQGLGWMLWHDEPFDDSEPAANDVAQWTRALIAELGPKEGATQ